MFKPRQKTGTEEVIDRLTSEMLLENGDSPEFAEMLTRLERLTKLHQYNTKQPVSRDTLALVFGNLAGIAMIVGHERAHVVTSKAIAFVRGLH